MSLLLDPVAMPAIPGLNLPYDLYWVTHQPAPLAGMPYPTSRTPWRELADAGFSQVVCLTESVPRYDPAPLRVAHAVELEDLFYGEPPREPVAEECRIRQAVSMVLERLAAADGVIVHCYGGRGRAGTVIGCVLRELGHDSAAVCAYLDTVHKARWKSGWPEALWQAQLVERFVP